MRGWRVLRGFLHIYVFSLYRVLLTVGVLAAGDRALRIGESPKVLGLRPANFASPLAPSLAYWEPVPRVAVHGRHSSTEVEVDTLYFEAWEASSFPRILQLMPGFSDDDSTGLDFAALQRAALAREKKRSIKRVFRLLALRGHAWYKGRHYGLDMVHELTEVEEFRNFVRELHTHDTSMTAEVLRHHGLFSIIEPASEVQCTEHDIRLSRMGRRTFGPRTAPVSSMPNGDPNSTSWVVQSVEPAGVTYEAGIRAGGVLLSCNGTLCTAIDTEGQDWKRQVLKTFRVRPEHTVLQHWEPRASAGIVLTPATGTDSPAEIKVPQELEEGKLLTEHDTTTRSTCRRSGKKYRGPIDRGLSWNVDTLKSERPDRDVAPVPPGKLEEHLLSAASRGFSFVALQGHRWQYTGRLHGLISGFQVFSAGANRQGAPEGLIMGFDTTWRSSAFSNQIIPLVGRIQLIRYAHQSSRSDHAFVNCIAPGEDHPRPRRERFYYHLDKAVNSLPSRTVKTLCGDLNPHLGREISPPHIEAHGYDEEENENGELLRRFTLEHDFRILIRMGDTCKANWRTATHANGHVLDFVLYDRRAHFSVRSACRLALEFPFQQSSTKLDHFPLQWAFQRTELLPSSRRASWRAASRRRRENDPPPVRWDRKMLARDLAQVKLSELSPKPEHEQIEVPATVIALRKNVLTRLRAAGPLPRPTVDETHFVIDTVLNDAGEEIYGKKVDQGRRLWIQAATIRIVIDKQEAVLAALDCWNRMCMIWWVALAWNQLRPESREQYLDPVLTCFAFKLWVCTHREVTLTRRAAEAVQRDRLEAFMKLAQKAEEADMQGDIKLTYKIIDAMAPRVKPLTGALRDEQGAYCFHRAQELEVWGRHIIAVFDAEPLHEEEPQDYTVYVMTPEQWREEFGDPSPPAVVLMRAPHIRAYVDGSALKGQRGYIAGWAVVFVLVLQGRFYVLAILFGNVCSAKGDRNYLGAETGTNNTGEATAQLRTHRFSKRRFPGGWPPIVFYDPTHATALATGLYTAKSNPELGSRLRGSFSAHLEVRPQLADQHVRGHSGDVHNDLVDECAKIGTAETGMRCMDLLPTEMPDQIEDLANHGSLYCLPSGQDPQDSVVAIGEKWRERQQELGRESNLGDPFGEDYEDPFDQDEPTSGGLHEGEQQGDDHGISDGALSDFSSRNPSVEGDTGDGEEGGDDTFYDAEQGRNEEDADLFLECIQDDGDPTGQVPDPGDNEWARKDAGFAKRVVFAPKNDKATQGRTSPVELAKLALHVIFTPLRIPCDQISVTRSFPQCWSDAIIFWVRKLPGDGSSTHHFRSICKLVRMGNGYFANHTRRIQQAVASIALPNVFAYLKGRSTLQPSFILEEVGKRFLSRIKNNVPFFLRNASLALLFVDLTKAFDALGREHIWSTFQELLPQMTGVKLEIQQLYSHTEYQLEGPGGEKRRFKINKGVRRGSGDGPILFALAYLAVLMKCRQDRLLLEWWIGVLVTPPTEDEMETPRTLSFHSATREFEGSRMFDLSDLTYADDVVSLILFTRSSQIVLIAKLWDALFTRIGLSIQYKKTQVMILWATQAQKRRWKQLKALRIPVDEPDEVSGMNDEELALFDLPSADGANGTTEPDDAVPQPKQSRSKHWDLRRRARRARASTQGGRDTQGEKLLTVVSSFVYLGSTFCAHWGCGEEVTIRISAAARANARLVLRVWRCSIPTIALEMKLYYSLVVSVMLYSLSGRMLTKGQVRRIETWHVRAVRRIAKVSIFIDRRTHTQVLTELKVFSVKSRLQQQRLWEMKKSMKGEPGVAVRAAVWSPLPWESANGGLSTARMKILFEDLQALLHSNKVSVDEDEAKDVIFCKGIDFLSGASKKQIDKVLNHDCSHMKYDGTGREEEAVDLQLQSPGCSRVCKNHTALRNHKVVIHKARDERRAAVCENSCPSCLTSFDLAYGLQYAKVHFKDAKCIEPKVNLVVGALINGEDASAVLSEEAPQYPFPRDFRIPQRGVSGLKPREIAGTCKAFLDLLASAPGGALSPLAIVYTSLDRIADSLPARKKKTGC